MSDIQLPVVESKELDIPDEIETSRSSRLGTQDILRVLDYHAQGVKQVDIAKIVGCSQSSVSRTLKDAERRAESVQRLMTAGIATKLDNWDDAARVAATRGDHRPAKEYLEMALPVLRPTQGSSAGGGGVQINIGIAGQPLRVPDITISASTSTIDALSLVPRNDLTAVDRG